MSSSVGAPEGSAQSLLEEEAAEHCPQDAPSAAVTAGPGRPTVDGVCRPALSPPASATAKVVERVPPAAGKAGTLRVWACPFVLGQGFHRLDATWPPPPTGRSDASRGCSTDDPPPAGPAVTVERSPDALRIPRRHDRWSQDLVARSRTIPRLSDHEKRAVHFTWQEISRWRKERDSRLSVAAAERRPLGFGGRRSAMQSPGRGGQDKAEEDAAPPPPPVGSKLEDAISTTGAVEQPAGDSRQCRGAAYWARLFEPASSSPDVSDVFTVLSRMAIGVCP